MANIADLVLPFICLWVAGAWANTVSWVNTWVDELLEAWLVVDGCDRAITVEGGNWGFVEALDLLLEGAFAYTVLVDSWVDEFLETFWILDEGFELLDCFFGDNSLDGRTVTNCEGSVWVLIDFIVRDSAAEYDFPIVGVRFGLVCLEFIGAKSQGDMLRQTHGKHRNKKLKNSYKNKNLKINSKI
jgi:hypothetical protein